MLYMLETNIINLMFSSDKARKRMTHNSIEKKRKDKIRYWINKIGELLPPVENSSDKERVGRVKIFPWHCKFLY